MSAHHIIMMLNEVRCKPLKLHDLFRLGGGEPKSCLGTATVKGITMTLVLYEGEVNYNSYIIMHEFGHALGLGHDHQTSHLAGALDESATIKWLMSTCRLTQVAAEQKYKDDYKPYTPEEMRDVQETPFDPESIMCYP